MTRTEELLKQARELGFKPMEELVELCRLQHEALKYAADKVYSEQNDDEIGEAIAAFNKFEGGE